MPLDDCQPFPPVPELALRAFGAGRRGGRAGPTVVPAVPPGGQAAAKVAAAV